MTNPHFVSTIGTNISDKPLDENQLLEIELAVLSGAYENTPDTLECWALEFIGEIRRLRHKQKTDDLSGLTRWPISDWHLLKRVVEQATPSVQFRQFIWELAKQGTPRPNYAKIYDELGLRRFEMDMYLKKLRDAGIELQWAHRPTVSG